MNERKSKVCTKCRTEKPLSAFGAEARTHDGLRAKCKECIAAYIRQYRSTHPEYVINCRRSRARVSKRWRNTERGKTTYHKSTIKRKYGESAAECYARMLEHQGGVCAICKGGPSNGNSRLSIDHCHRTGQIRGLLCTHCNFALGFFKDNPELLHAAILYLKAHSDTSAEPTRQPESPSV